MDNTKLLEILNDLIQADIDAYYIAHKGSENVENEDNINYLTKLEESHKERVVHLSSIVYHLGGTPPVKQDLKGYILEGVIALSGLMTQKRVLEWVQLSEQKIALLYQELKKLIYDDQSIEKDVKNLLNAYLINQQEYLQSMEKLLKAA